MRTPHTAARCRNLKICSACKEDRFSNALRTTGPSTWKQYNSQRRDLCRVIIHYSSTGFRARQRTRSMMFQTAGAIRPLLGCKSVRSLQIREKQRSGFLPTIRQMVVALVMGGDNTIGRMLESYASPCRLPSKINGQVGP